MTDNKKRVTTGSTGGVLPHDPVTWIVYLDGEIYTDAKSETDAKIKAAHLVGELDDLERDGK